MPRRSPPRELLAVIAALVRRDPRWLIVVVLVAMVLLYLDRRQAPRDLGPAPEPPGEGYLFCSWNVENLFDDADDPRNHDPLDAWFAADPEALRLKLDLLAETLIPLDGGRGPDVLALIEVENRRAVELLLGALNARLPTEWHYTRIVHDDNISGRRIEPALITRLPVDDRSTLVVDDRRMIRARLVVDDRPLDVIVAHWTSRVTDREGPKRLAYARAMYDTYLGIERNTDGLADVLLCGDFNDGPDDESVRLGLRATGDRPAVSSSAGGGQPRLYNLMAGRDPEDFGTYRYRGRWQILDHLVASPGLLDPDGWAILPDSLRVVSTIDIRDSRDGPLRFGNPDNQNPRGPSDHFAVTVRLRPPGSAGQGQGQGQEAGGVVLPE
ncbi:endonuclease/exonuclease/phosphatase family protein [Tautonia plasticadhaerens]|uniref:Endonuclease/Exonuclease/phosphatase family protein n=1 Tax=Tautonia plasticadhaerens TaxID=2527974 RepID=A0A518GXF4_9BACT|nr:endonuclease/exonuclease/phosphatase family protein [Tautonia plasticadhaerens]QDV33284.1 Endonuclease/Exonuclease/phosphatase family protein [Tautonia plasticadhaerens]